MRRFSSRLTSGRRSTPRTRVKMAALAPMPSASVSATVMARPLVRASERSATLKSRRNDIFCSSVGGWSATYLNLVQERAKLENVSAPSTPSDGPDDQQRLLPGYHGVGQGCMRRFVRQILLGCEEAQEGTALLRDVIANGAAQHWILGLERIDHRAHCGLAADFELHFTADARQSAQMWRQHDADHGSVWTSTESTAGRSRTMGAQLSPASAEAYTCPPLVPKYTPHLSSESTAIASPKTFT